jgi:hypothetical protein
MGRLAAVLLAAMAMALAWPSGPWPSTPAGARPAYAQEADPPRTESSARVEFGSEIRFQLRAESAERIRSVLLLYQVDDSNVQNTGVPSYQPGLVVSATYAWRVASVLAPGSEVRYQWQLETESGKRYTTPEQTVTYSDARFTWREAKADQVTVFHREGDGETGQALLDEARKVQARLNGEYGLSLERPLRIYAYTRQQDYVSALGGRAQDVATTVGSDRIFVLAPSGTANMATSLRALRREVAHAVFIQKTRNPYTEPPRWLTEGFALYIGGEEISPESYRALGQYAQANRLLPLRTLNGNFPTTDRELALAYAESLTVVKFIIETYGADKFRALLAAFKEGNTVDDALKKGLGVTLDQLETRWKNALRSGSLARPAGSQRSAPGETQTGSGGVADRLLGPAIRYWRGILGDYTVPVLIGLGSLAAIGVVALIVSPFYLTWKRAREEE